MPDEVEHVKSLVKKDRDKIHKIIGVAGTGISHSDFTGVGTGHQVVVYLEKMDENIIKSLPKTINGVQVVYEVTGKFKALSVYCNYGGSGFANKYRPLKSGSSLGKADVVSLEGYCDAGTLGGFPYLSDGSQRVGLSNNHVIAHDMPGVHNANVGDLIIQPGTLDGGDTVIDAVGTLLRWDTLYDKSSGKTNKYDAAIFQIDPSVTIDLNALCNYNMGYTIEPKLGMPIKKSSRSTGCQIATITQVGINVDVYYSDTGVATFEGQFRTSDNFVQAGDSGSVVVHQDSNNVLGLIFAGIGTGSGIFSRMSDVEAGMGITFGCPELQCSPIAIDGVSGATYISDSPHTFSVMTAGGTGTLSYIWHLDGILISQNSSFTQTLSQGTHTLGVSVSDACITGVKNCSASTTINVLPSQEIIICGFNIIQTG